MWKELGIAAGLIICFFAIQKLGRRRGDESRSARLMKKYKDLSADLLASTPDEELVEAVVAHVLAQAAESRKPDPVYTLSKLPQPFTVAYSIWAVCKELAQGNYHALTRTATGGMVEPACDSLPVIGAPRTAEALSALVVSYKRGEDTAEAEHVFHQAVESECPLSLCAVYLRDHVDALLGKEPVEETVTEDLTDGE